ncbi:MAG: hypothetical protein ACP5D9_10290 [Mariniphaga sp.]
MLRNAPYRSKMKLHPSEMCQSGTGSYITTTEYAVWERKAIVPVRIGIVCSTWAFRNEPD